MEEHHINFLSETVTPKEDVNHAQKLDISDHYKVTHERWEVHQKHHKQSFQSPKKQQKTKIQIKTTEKKDTTKNKNTTMSDNTSTATNNINKQTTAN